MARSGTGIGYTPSQTPTSMPGGFDEEQMAVARQRAMLTALANQPAVESGYRGAHYVNPYRAQIGPALLQLMNENAQPEMDAQLQDVARRRGEYTDQLLSNPPQMADIPADPGNAGPSEGPGMMGPPAPMPGYEGEPVVGDQNQMGLDYARAFAAKQRGMGQDAAINMETGAPTALADTQMQPLEAAPAAPMVPQAPQDFAPHRAATAMVPKWDMGRTLKWAGDLAGASPMGAKIAEKFIDTKLDEPRQTAIRAEKAQLELDKLRETVAARIEAAQTTQAGREFLQKQGFDQQQLMARVMQGNREDLIRLAAALKPEKSTPVEHTTLQGYDVATGRPVNRAPNGTLYRAGEDGKPEATPFVGETMTVAAKEKEVAKVQTAMEHRAAVQDMLRQAETNEGAFGSGGALLGVVPGPLGVWASTKNLTPEQVQTRSEFAKNAAKITHDLYGSAFTSGEQVRASPFIVQPSDPPEKVLANLKAMLKEADRANTFQSRVAKQAAQARVGGGASSAGKTVVKRAVGKDGKTYVRYSDGSEGVE